MYDLFPINWTEFHFLRPQFLWGFIAVGIILILGLLGLREKVQWKKVIAPHLRPFVIGKGSERIKILMQIMLAIGLSAGILALAGPTWKKQEVPGQTLETPMVILLDLSQSMMADDIQPNRLERAKFKITDLLNAKPGARVALIGFAGTAHTIVPLTRDYKIIKSHVETLSPKVMPFRGSDLQKALTLADTLMSVTDAPGTVVIFSDNFENEQFKLLQEFTRESNNKVVIMPMNTPSGSDVPAYSGRGKLLYKGEPVHSELNSAVLSQLKSLKDISVNQLTLDNSDVEFIAKSVRDNLKFTEAPEEKEDAWQDAGLLLILPMIFILLFWFRKGWVVYSLLFMATLSGCSEKDTDFADLWYTKDYQGQKASDAGDFAAAAKLYKDPLRKGVAYFKAGNYDDAIKAFSKDTTAMGAYNLGLAYFGKGDYAAAQLAFGEAAEMDPELTAARKNANQIQKMMGGINEVNPEEAKEAPAEQTAENKQNDSSEDFSGGGQEATKKDMEKERMEETVSTDMRTAKELDEVPDDLGNISQQNNQKVLMRKIDDDPARFLEKKFEFQAKEDKLKPNPDEKPW